MHVPFQTTDWQLIADACSPSISRREGAVEILFRSYLPPIQAWLQRCGADPQRSDELAHDFMAKILLEANLLASADPTKGRLRVLLKHAARQFRIDAVRRAKARKRAEGKTADAQGLISNDAAVDEAAFDADWARQQLQITINRARDLMIATGRSREWAVFEQAILLPCVHGTARPSMAEVARRAGLPSAETASSLLFTARRRVEAMFREVVSETVGAAGDFREELLHVERVLGAAIRR
jgi:DNA-directed RNA polymerase specialized sigma24 family protein